MLGLLGFISTALLRGTLTLRRREDVVLGLRSLRAPLRRTPADSGSQAAPLTILVRQAAEAVELTIAL